MRNDNNKLLFIGYHMPFIVSTSVDRIYIYMYIVCTSYLHLHLHRIYICISIHIIPRLRLGMILDLGADTEVDTMNGM